ncbi:MAG: coenzyme F420-0:L-glutamate ligase [Oscillospiraceae bacterium]|jgi:F420-0:gamma-glutamyl ligase|nr:coenzyme F420-0:L-glutamate ligase [Oscillospiraceae bacterium]
MRMTGTVSRGIRAPIIKNGDDLVEIVAVSVTEAAKSEGFALRDRDIVGVTESVLARSQGNYATLAQIAADVRRKFPGGTVGVTLPILSRNRFSQILRGIAGGADKLYIQLAYPGDEVGNPLLTWEQLDEKGIDPHTDVLEEAEFAALFGKPLHPFTGVDYVSYYKELAGGKASVIFGNDPRAVLKYTKHVITADIHTRHRSKKLLRAAGAETVFGLDELLNEPVDGSGYHPQYGLLGSNLSAEDSVKLFPRDAQAFAGKAAARLLSLTGKKIEVLVYGDGAFKDPVGGIWELADPVVSPGYTTGLEGTPNELKIKYLADTAAGDKRGEAASEMIRDMIRRKKDNLVGDMSSQGTTPRRLTDLLGSLCDLTSGSGDKGTPIILIQGYFDTYADL